MSFEIDDIVEATAPSDYAGMQIRVTSVSKGIVRGIVTKTTPSLGTWRKNGSTISFYVKDLMLAEPAEKLVRVNRTILVKEGWGPCPLK